MLGPHSSLARALLFSPFTHAHAHASTRARTRARTRTHAQVGPSSARSCPNSSLCGSIRKKDLEAHQRVCERIACSHRLRGCKAWLFKCPTHFYTISFLPTLLICSFLKFSHLDQFVGTRAALEEHLRDCRYESVKGLLAEHDQRVDRLAQTVDAKEQV